MSTQPKSGEVIVNKYRLERELGAGGMGSVWLATQLMVDRPVAVKLLHPAFVDQQELQDRFEVEAKAIGKLNHPNVITLYDFGYSDGLEAFYTVIEYIDGVSLDKRLNQRMPLREVVSIMRQIALALDHAHHHGILHRDLKPENVMLARMTDGSEMVKVLDFGIARIVKGTYENESPESQRITKAGEVFGTPAYMSPEQARSIRRLNPSADLYSLGVMFYELVAGRLPFFANSAFDLLMLHVTKPVPPIPRNDVPKEVADIIYRLLEKEPEKRFQTGKELAKTLDRLALPEESEAEDEEYEGHPTLVSKVPEAFAQRAQETLGNEETSPRSSEFALPIPGYVPPTAEIRAQTVLMHGGQDSSREHDTIPRRDRAREVGGLILLTLLAVLVMVVVFALAFTGEEEPRRPTLPPQLFHPQTAGPTEQPQVDPKAVPNDVPDASAVEAPDVGDAVVALEDVGVEDKPDPPPAKPAVTPPKTEPKKRAPTTKPPPEKVKPGPRVRP